MEPKEPCGEVFRFLYSSKAEVAVGQEECHFSEVVLSDQYSNTVSRSRQDRSDSNPVFPLQAPAVYKLLCPKKIAGSG